MASEEICPIEAFIAFYEGSGLTNMRPDAARIELARLRGLESLCLFTYRKGL